MILPTISQAMLTHGPIVHPYRLHHFIWLVVDLPLWKMMEFVSWDDDIPNINGQSYKPCSKPPTSYGFVPHFSIFSSSKFFILNGLTSGNQTYGTTTTHWSKWFSWIFPLKPPFSWKTSQPATFEDPLWVGRRPNPAPLRKFKNFSRSKASPPAPWKICCSATDRRTGIVGSNLHIYKKNDRTWWWSIQHWEWKWSKMGDRFN